MFQRKPEIPSFIKALVNTEGTWLDKVDLNPDQAKPVEVTFSFALPIDETALEAFIDFHHDEAESLVTLGSADQFFFRHALALWESMTNIKFIEVVDHPQVPVFSFVKNDPESNTLGYAYFPSYKNEASTKTSRGIGFEATYLDRNRQYYSSLAVFKTMLHEIGHVLGLKHPFVTLNETTTDFSLMNYNHREVCDDQRCKLMIPITPMWRDGEAVQAIYGKNQHANVGDDVYYLIDYVKSDALYTSIAILPEDVAGEDTISAIAFAKVTINLNPYAESTLCYQHNKNCAMVVMPNIGIENVIAAVGENKIILNSLPNKIDMRFASENSTIHLNPQQNNHDIIIGFKPLLHQLVLQKNTAMTIERVKSGSMTIANQTIAYDHGTKINFYNENSVTLAGVNHSELTKNNIVFDEEIANSLWTIFSDMPADLFLEFRYAFCTSSILTFLDRLTDEALKEFECTPTQIMIIRQAIQCLMILATGSVVANTAGFMMDAVMGAMGFSANTCHTARTLTVLAANVVASPAAGVAKLMTTLAGGYAGNHFIMWAFPPKANQATAGEQCRAQQLKNE